MATAARKPSKFRERLDWIYKNRPDLPHVTELSLMAGLSKGAIGNTLAAAEDRGEEPNFMRSSLEGIAGAARVSLSWLMGLTNDPDGSDIPPAPKVDGQTIAKRRLGKAADAEELESRVERLEKQVSQLLQKTQK